MNGGWGWSGAGDELTEMPLSLALPLLPPSAVSTVHAEGFLEVGCQCVTRLPMCVWMGPPQDGISKGYRRRWVAGVGGVQME